jgi:hypothetical protein
MRSECTLSPGLSDRPGLRRRRRFLSYKNPLASPDGTIYGRRNSRLSRSPMGDRDFTSRRGVVAKRIVKARLIASRS